MAKLTTKQRRGKARSVIPYTPPVGRPTKLNDDIQAIIFDALVRGNTRTCASALAGISYITFLNWMERGEGVDGKACQTEEDQAYFRFFIGVSQAEAEAHSRNIQNIQRAGDRKNWQAAAWWAERRHRDWQRTDTVEHTGPDGKPLEIVHRHRLDLSVLTDAELIAYRNAVAKAQGKADSIIDVTPVEAKP